MECAGNKTRNEGTSLKSQEQVCSLFKTEPHKRLRSSEVDLTDSFIAS